MRHRTAVHLTAAIALATLLSLLVLPRAYAAPLAPHLLDTLSASPGFPEMTSVADYYAQKAASEARERRLAHESRRQAVSTRKPPADALTEAQVRSLLKAAAKHYGVDSWIVTAGLQVAWGESRFRPDARNGQYVGIMQFGASWGSEAKRLDPEWSIYRFVRVYAEGGKQKVRQHWKATIGGL